MLTETRSVSRLNDSGRRYLYFAKWLAASPACGGWIVSIVVYEPHAASAVDCDMLARLYGLTPMESRLAATLFIEPVLPTVALRCGISINTAKTHLKHIFGKCSVRSKAELLRLLALGPLAGGAGATPVWD
jgi:hypothetical protein